MVKYVVTIDHDSDVESPCDWCGSWKIYSFSNRHVNFRNPSEFFGDNGKPLLAFRNKLRVGLAHILSYYEHGQCRWMLSGNTGGCPDWQWDGVDVAGVAVWEESPSNMGAKSQEDRAKDCEQWLDVYTDWCNGACYWYQIEQVEEDEDGREYADRVHVDSCGGFIGEDSVAEAIQESLPEDATEENTEIEGDGKWIADYHDIFKTAKA